MATGDTIRKPSDGIAFALDNARAPRPTASQFRAAGYVVPSGIPNNIEPSSYAADTPKKP